MVSKGARGAVWAVAWAVAVAVVVLPPADARGAAGASARSQVSLNGQWTYQVVGDLDAPLKADAWQPISVPGYLRGHDYRRAWFRRTFTVPASMRGRRIALHFGGVKYNSRVQVNGRGVGGCFGGYRPFELDVTDAVRFDRPNELLVGCHDWTGVFSPGKVSFADARGSALRQVPRDKVLSPVGGLFGHYGIWDDVTLRARPAVYVKDLFIKPSVRRGELVVDCTVANDSPRDVEVDLRAAVEGKGADVLLLPPGRLRVPAGTSASATLRAKWASPRLWSHVSPYLYHLRTSLSTGDELRTRFGFREFWIEGHDFYLNGRKIHLLATSGWPARVGATDPNEIRRTWRAVKDAGCVAFRTHTQPWRSVYYDAADEVGLLIVIEGAVFNDDTTYRIDDPAFWNNYAGHLRAMVDRDKNRPSVVMWSLENEFWGSRLNDDSPAKADLVRMGRLMKRWDPTRPILYESDGDPGGVADVIGIHYPHEYPFHTCWPNEAWWLARPQPAGRRFHNGRKEFLWRKDKPLYVGEFLWLPSHDPSWHTVFLGDRAYLDYGRCRNVAKAMSWRMQVLGYRHFEVGGMCPWTMMEGGPLDEANPLHEAVKYGYQPVAAFCHDYDSRFYSGEKVTRRVEVFNDVPTPSELVLEWKLSAAGQAVDAGRQALKLAPAEQRALGVDLRMPDVRRRTTLRWQLTLSRSGRRVFADVRDYHVLPALDLSSAGGRVGLFDPAGTTRRRLAAAGLETIAVAALDRLDAAMDVLILGERCLDAGERREAIVGQVDPRAAALGAFADGGGRILVLRQDAYPPGLFGVSLSTHRSTMTFPLRPSHPALRGVEGADLRFWRGDHMVTAAEPVRPDAGGARAILASGSAAGLDHAPLLEMPVGRGCIVHSQLRLIEKLTSEPAAGVILKNLLAYLARYRPARRKTAVAGGSAAYRSRLRGLGLRFDDLTGTLGEADLSAYSLLVCRGGLPAAGKLRRFVEAGGNVLAHRVAAGATAEVHKAFGVDVAFQPYAGTVRRAEGTHPLLEAIAREDVYWLGEPARSGSTATPRAARMADGALTKTLAGKSPAAHEAETWKLTGQIVRRQKDHVVFATVGAAEAEIDFPADGRYIVGIVARGTPCRGTYPLARVSIDGEAMGFVAAARETWHTATTFGRVRKGRHKVAVAFINDESDPPREDRNLFLDKVLIAPDDAGDAGGVAFLTRPPTTAVLRRGKGSLVIDQLRWDTEQRNTRKAARYACCLLAELGGDFASRLGTPVECERMTPQPGITQFRRQGTFVSLATNGYVSTRFEVASAGAYAMELVAAGSAAEGAYPLVEVHLDGRAAGRVQLTHGGWRAYPVDLTLSKGRHELKLAFTNDRCVPGVADRNLRMDKVVFYRR